MKIAKTMLGLLALSGAAAGLSAPVSALDWKNVTDERLVNADKEPENWLIYGRTYNAQRYSPLDQINVSNIAKLKPA